MYEASTVWLVDTYFEYKSHTLYFELILTVEAFVIWNQAKKTRFIIAQDNSSLNTLPQVHSNSTVSPSPRHTHTHAQLYRFPEPYTNQNTM